jgi:hypothetical protein
MALPSETSNKMKINAEQVPGEGQLTAGRQHTKGKRRRNERKFQKKKQVDRDPGESTCEYGVRLSAIDSFIDSFIHFFPLCLACAHSSVGHSFPLDCTIYSRAKSTGSRPANATIFSNVSMNPPSIPMNESLQMILSASVETLTE